MGEDGRMGRGTYLCLRQVLTIQRVAGIADIVDGIRDGIFVGLCEGYPQLDRILWLSRSKRNEAIGYALDVLVKDKPAEVRSKCKTQVDER